MANPNPNPATRFLPGQSGNPGGRPKGESFATVLRDLLEREHRKAPNWRAAVAVKAIELAAKGDLDAIKWVADRTDGKVRDGLDVETRSEVVIRVVRDRATGAAPLRPPPDPATDPV